MTQEAQELLYFWVIGDMHFRAREQWEAFHAPRMRTMFDDIHAVWDVEGLPAFCVAPGDIVDKGHASNYALAKRELAVQLGTMPFYPGIGNHEYQPETLQDNGQEILCIPRRSLKHNGTVQCAIHGRQAVPTTLYVSCSISPIHFYQDSASRISTLSFLRSRWTSLIHH